MPRLAILAATPHASSTKALSMLGLGRSRVAESRLSGPAGRQ